MKPKINATLNSLNIRHVEKYFRQHLSTLIGTFLLSRTIVVASPLRKPERGRLHFYGKYS
jgi:hypothetical protein